MQHKSTNETFDQRIKRIKENSIDSVCIEGNLTTRKVADAQIKIGSAFHLNLFLVVHFDQWHHILNDWSFGDWIDPATRFEMLHSGLAGRLLGMSILTDGFDLPQHQSLVVDKSFIYNLPKDFQI